MKRLIHRWLFAFLFFYFISGIAMADNVISVNFESGIPVGWTATGITVKKDNNSMRAAMSSNAILISPAIDNPTQVSYKHRGSGNNKELIVEKSTDGGNTWTQIGSTKVSSSSSYGASGHSIGESASVGVLIRFTCKSATIYIDDIEISYVNLSAEPTKQASLETVEVTGNSVRLNITPGDGAGHLVAYTEGEDFSWTPTDGNPIQEVSLRKWAMLRWCHPIVGHLWKQQAYNLVRLTLLLLLLTMAMMRLAII